MIRGDEMDTQQQLFGLMAIAEDQQKAVSEALAGLEREREALARERQALASERADLVPAVRKISRDAFAGAAGVIEKAARPSIDGLSDVVKAAGALEGRLSMRWLSWCLCVAVGAVLVVMAATWGALEWQRHEVRQLQEEKKALAAEVAEMQENAAEWSRRGMKARLFDCGEKGKKFRPCVRVDTSSAYGDEGDIFVLDGY